MIERDVGVVVLSTGIWQRLQVCLETWELSAENDIGVEVLQTENAVKRSRETGPLDSRYHIRG